MWSGDETTLPVGSVRRRFRAVRVLNIEEDVEVEVGGHLAASGKRLTRIKAFIM